MTVLFYLLISHLINDCVVLLTDLISSMSVLFYLLISHLINSRSQVVSVLVAVVIIPIMLWQQVNVVKNEAVEIFVFQGFNNANI